MKFGFNDWITILFQENQKRICFRRPCLNKFLNFFRVYVKRLSKFRFTIQKIITEYAFGWYWHSRGVFGVPWCHLVRRASRRLEKQAFFVPVEQAPSSKNAGAYKREHIFDVATLFRHRRHYTLSRARYVLPSCWSVSLTTWFVWTFLGLHNLCGLSTNFYVVHRDFQFLFCVSKVWNLHSVI